MQPQDLVTLTIDGHEVSVPRGTTVLHAAERLGIEIPTFCYSKKMDPLGACRMCLVQIEKTKGYPPSCATPVAPGMVVNTISPEVAKTQQGILEFLLINHPLDCPICDKGGECPLQNQTFKYGPGKSRYAEEKRHFVKHLPIGPQIVLDRERCIVCQLCVRFMDDVADDPQIVLLSRGGKTEVNVFPDRPFDSPFAGNTIELCPVGALTSRKYRFRARPWDLEHAPGVCPTCAVGCNVTLDTRRGELLRLSSRENVEVDDGWLCDHGRFGTLDRQFAGERLLAPQIRQDGELVESSWEEALLFAAEGLRRARAGTVGVLGSPRATNEELYLLGRLTRGALRSPHIAVPGASPAPTAALGGAAIADIEEADVIILIDADPVARQHVLDLRLKKQVKRREVPLVVLSNDETGLGYLARATAPFDAANPLATVERLLHLLAAPEQPGSRVDTGLIQSAISTLRGAAGAALGGVTNLIGGAVEPGPDPLQAAADALRGKTRGLVLYDERILAVENVSDLVEGLRALATAVAPGRDGALLALAAHGNSRGATEMGAHGSYLAGGVPVTDATIAATLARAWGTQPVTGQGRAGAGIVDGLQDGTLQALLVHGFDPIADGIPGAVDALKAAPFIVLLTARSGPAVEHADVVLPIANFGETSGTLTNLEGRVQRLARAMRASGDVREGWQALSDLADALDGGFAYTGPGQVSEEIARVTGMPSWAALLQRAVEPIPAGATR